MNNMRSLLLVFLAIFALPAMAVEPDNRFQAGFVMGNMSVGGSPIDVGSNTETGGSLVYIRNISDYVPNAEVTLGLSRQKHTLSMGGGDLGGGVDSTTASATARYRFLEEGDKSPATCYVGLGGHATSFNSGSYMGGGLRTSSGTMTGAVAEIGTRISLSNRRYYVDVNARQYFGSTGNIRLETTVGNALVTNVNYKDISVVVLSFGGTF